MDVIVIGLGPIGQRAVRHMHRMGGFHVVGAVDVNPDLVGRPLNQVVEGVPWDLTIDNQLESVLASHPGTPVLMYTRSHVPEVMDTLETVLRYGHPVVTTTEELADPWIRYPEESARLDQLAREHGVALIGTGVNPGFAMDFLPGVLTAVVHELEHVAVYRHQEAFHRRYPLQKKIGSGLTVAEFEEKWARREMGHVGLVESAYLLGRMLGWTIDRVEEDCRPVLATEDIQTEYFHVRPGQVQGILHTVRACEGDRERIYLELQMALRVEDPRDEVVLKGDPPLRMVIPGGLPGDPATVNISLGMVRVIRDLPPGLRTMGDLPVPHYRKGA